MTDGVIKSTGNSRYMKIPANAKTLYPSLTSLLNAMIDGTFSFDLNGVNPDGWSTQGTPLNKANLLSDATGAMFGLGTSGTPNQAFAFLGKYNRYWWRRTKIKSSSTTTVEVCRFSTTEASKGVLYSSGLAINGSTIGLGSQINSLVIRHGDAASVLDVLTGKFFIPQGKTTIYYCAGSPTRTGSGTNSSPYVYKVSASAVSVGTEDYVQSASATTYPENGVSGDYYYEGLGIPFEFFMKRKSIAFTYIGTNSYGASNPTVLTFPFNPSVVIVGSIGGSPSNAGAGLHSIDGWQDSCLFISGQIVAHINGYYSDVSFSGNAISLYSTRSAVCQLNSSAFVYGVVALV